MNVFVAGGSGTIGIPLVRALVAEGHQVTALTRSTSRQDDLHRLGASVAVADALNRDSLIAAVVAARPTHVIHQLTALPKGGARRASDLQATNRLRIDGTRNLLEAAIKAGAQRFLVGSFALLSDPGVVAPSADEAAAMIDLIRKRRLPVVRGDRGQLPLIHIEDAVSATVRALDAAPAGSTYDIVDDHAVSFAEIVERIARYTGSAAPRKVPAWLPRLVAPYMARLTSIRVSLSNAKAKAELGWRLKYPTMDEGLTQMFRHAA